MILRNDIPKTCRYTRMILYSLQHFKALQLHIRTGEMRREKIYPAEHLGGKKYPAHQGCQKKNLLTRNHPPPPPQELNGRPLIAIVGLFIPCYLSLFFKFQNLHVFARSGVLKMNTPRSKKLKSKTPKI